MCDHVVIVWSCSDHVVIRCYCVLASSLLCLGAYNWQMKLGDSGHAHSGVLQVISLIACVIEVLVCTCVCAIHRHCIDWTFHTWQTCTCRGWVRHTHRKQKRWHIYNCILQALLGACLCVCLQMSEFRYEAAWRCSLWENEEDRWGDNSNTVAHVVTVWCCCICCAVQDAV